MMLPHLNHIIIIGAGAAGLMAARELGRGGKRVTILEARDRCGGRIYPLPAADFGYAAEGGAEFVHGEAPVTRALLREAQLSLLPIQGTRWHVDDGVFSRGVSAEAHWGRFQQALQGLQADLTIAEFLKRHFADPQDDRLRAAVERMVEDYDAADPARHSALALRDEWINGAPGGQARICGGYGALIDFLRTECRRHGVVVHLGTAVTAIETTDGRALARCASRETYEGDAVILTVPLPLLREIALPPAVSEKAAMSASIGYGNVVKLLLRFRTRWWTGTKARELTDLSFLRSDGRISAWWTQYPAEHPVFTGWLAGPRTEILAHLAEGELVGIGLASLAEIFGISEKRLKRNLVRARAINWGNDPFARGAYSYATLETRQVQLVLADSRCGMFFFSGEALYRGADIGTVEAGLASGLETAQTILAAG
jgi:monoamine oxidase